MGPRVSLGGNTQVNNVVLQRLEDDIILGLAKYLTGQAGKGDAVVTQQKLDDEGNPIHDPFQWTGKLKRFKLADVQSQGNAAAQCEAEIEVSGQMA
jgi:hypothetical protein